VIVRWKMQMQQIRYFLALCEERSFTHAAKRCGVSQPSLTNAILALEQELGGVLFQRKNRGVFSPWHFVDWPADAAAYSDSFCSPECIVNELPKQIEAMRTSTNTEAKALAMSWVIHLMGDLHQPMHVTDRGDRGGNEFKVTYNGRTRCRESNSSGTETKVELHSVWDSCLVFTLESGRTFDKLADDLRGNLTTYKGHPATSGSMMDWMRETHQAGIDTAYDGLSNGDDLAGVYIQHALPVVQQQLLNAGIRLAKIIDENF
jgi:hypothetical protein